MGMEGAARRGAVHAPNVAHLKPIHTFKCLMRLFINEVGDKCTPLFSILKFYVEIIEVITWLLFRKIMLNKIKM